jgi:hypothetical protein
MAQDLWLELGELIQTATEPQAKEWFIHNLSRFDAESRDSILLAFYDEAARKRDGKTYAPGEEFTYQDFRNVVQEMANVARVLKSERGTSIEKPPGLDQIGQGITREVREGKAERIVTIGSMVVHYRIDRDDQNRKAIEHIDAKLTEILTNNPNANRGLIEGFYGIRISYIGSSSSAPPTDRSEIALRAPEKPKPVTFGDLIRKDSTPSTVPLREQFARTLDATERLTPEERKQIKDFVAPIVPIAKQLLEKKLGIKFPEPKKSTEDVDMGDIE